MRRLVLAALVLAAVAVSRPNAAGRVLADPAPDGGAIAPPLSPRNASYSIDARLDAPSRTIAGSEVVTWRNITKHPTSELQFHLYWNAWRNDRSTWRREAALGRGGRNLAAPAAGDWARMDVSSIRLLASTGRAPGGANPAAADLKGHYIQPDDGNADDETVMGVPLPEPAPPGATLTFEVKWDAHVPRTFARTGAIGNFFFIAQWFPKLGVLEDDGWNCHQFHASTEFFSDYGTYDVNLTVPTGWVVGATGVERETHPNADGTTRHRFYQDDVHDFAWTTSPDYLVKTARFDHPPLPPVEMRLLLQPEHAGQAERHFDATRATLQYYGDWYGPYPYGHITIVDPAWQSGAGGMEYPTLFTAGTRWLVLPDLTSPESVTIHEAGHQFWYGLVGNNEFEDAWMDEGINTFSEARAESLLRPSYLSQRYFGGFIPWEFDDVRLSREDGLDRLAMYRAVAKQDRQSTPSYRYWPTSGGGITYAKTALWMNTMERWIGWPALQRVMSTYFARWKFRHPKPRDFFDTASETLGRDIGWYFDQVYRSSNVFDYGVGEFASVRSADGTFHTTAEIRRYGEAIFPVDVLVTFADGASVTERWDGRDRWKLYTYDRPVKAATVQVDPKHVLLLDVNYTNNSRTLTPRAGAAATKWSTKWMVWLEDALLSWATFV